MKTLVFLHGWAGLSSSWNKNVEYFEKKGFACHAFDLPGFGLLEPVLWGIPEYAEHVTKEIKQKFPNKKVVLIGHSFGGRISIYIASKYPEIIDSLILSDSAGINLEPTFLRKSLMSLSRTLRRLEDKFKPLSSIRKYAINLFGSTDYKKSTPAMREVMKKVVNLDLRDMLPNIKCKTLIIWGEKDKITPLAIAHFLNKGIKNSQLEVVKNAGHHTHKTHADQWNAITRQFISDLPPSINDDEVLRVQGTESHEKLVSLLDLDRVYLPSQIKTDIGILDSENMFVRETVKKMLKKALETMPTNLGFVLIEGYRSYGSQKRLFDKEIARFKKLNPKLSEEELKKQASKFVSNPDVYSPHVTGGAIDLGIVDENLEMLDMGNMFGYDDSAKTEYGRLTYKQRLNRKLLLEAMESAGFVNYPYEWWHYSYGDKYWGYTKNNPTVYHTINLK